MLLNFINLSVLVALISFSAGDSALAAPSSSAQKHLSGVRVAQNAEDGGTESPAESKPESKPEAKAEQKPEAKPQGKAEMRSAPIGPEMKSAPLTAPIAGPAPNAPPESAPVIEAPPAPPPKGDDRIANELKRHCERHFPGQIQAEVRGACASAGVDFERLGSLGGSLVQTRCRVNYGDEPRLVMACLIGAAVSENLRVGQEGFKKKLQLCAENYPVHNEIDAFLQESCLTGIHIPELMNTEGKQRFEACAQITPERSFIGPCAVGLTLAQEPETQVAPAQQNKACDQYFNLNRFHKGYRACLNARSLATASPAKFPEAIKNCANILSEANNDTERAACLVGLTIYRHLSRREDVAKRFQKCGDNKVTYQDRDFLACLTAASLLDFTDKSGAQAGCREVFKELKSHSRGDCLNSLSLF